MKLIEVAFNSMSVFLMMAYREIHFDPPPSFNIIETLELFKYSVYVTSLTLTLGSVNGHY